MKILEKLNLRIGLFFVIAIGAFDLFLFYKISELSEPDYKIETTEYIQPLPSFTPTPTPILPPYEWTKNNFNLQAFLAVNCKKIDTGINSFYYGFPITKMPFKVDSKFISVKTKDDNYLSCGFYDPGKNNGFISLKSSTDNDTMVIYDKNSYQPGGTYSHVGIPGKVLEDKDNIKISAFIFGFPEGGDALIEYLGIAVIGDKEFKTSSGTTNVSFTQIAIPVKDERLLEILNKYSIDSKQEPGKKAYDFSIAPADDEIISIFFSDMSNLQSPEKEAAKKVREVLSSVSLGM